MSVLVEQELKKWKEERIEWIGASHVKLAKEFGERVTKAKTKEILLIISAGMFTSEKVYKHFRRILEELLVE